MIVLPSCRITVPLRASQPSTEERSKKPITSRAMARFCIMMRRLARLRPTASKFMPPR